MGLLLGLLMLVLAVGEPFALASSSTQPIARVTTLLRAASSGASCNRSGLDHLSHTGLATGHGCLVRRGVAQRASLTAHGLDCFYCERHGLGFRLVILSFLPLHRVLLAVWTVSEIRQFFILFMPANSFWCIDAFSFTVQKPSVSLI